MAPKKAAPGKAGGGPPLKKAKKAVAIWEWRDGEDWKEFAEKDMEMLEGRYIASGPKGKFVTSDFTFNQGFDTLYEVNLEKGTQKNLDTKKSREIRRKDPLGAKAALWEWWNDNGEWSPYNEEDKNLLDKAFASGITPFLTKALSFNKGYDSLYIIDFSVMTQVNSDSGTSRKIQRTAAGGSKIFGHVKGEDDAYADVLATGDAEGAADEAKFGDAEFVLDLPPALIKAQKAKGPQSLRKQARDFGPTVTKDKHGTMCFNEMLKNEKEFCGEWAVFYHSYSAAAILYEVQAAVGSVLFRFKAEFAGLARILCHGFKKIPDAPTMLAEFPKWKDQDHNPAFKAVGLCATSSLLADDAEAPAKSVFLMGYSVGSLKGVLEKLLTSCGVPKHKVPTLAKDILAAAAKHGLDCSGIPGGKKCKSGRSGHMLQIFIRRELVDKYVYPAFPFGPLDASRNLPYSKHLTDQAPIKGQVRITLNPDVFLRARYVRMFTFSADPTYHGNRTTFIKELVALLDPILKDEKVRTMAAKGIFGGKPPDWWTAEDQSELAEMPAERYASSTL
mmetsp:Transcript_9958/g.22206  ORF Transcript_9958/g.22206 Transcript_9958/m.22206 type:complete len:559 (-) Transcript_9958:154-1830(-)|eukprot:CAMPEP_0170593430 /NCGR_PEP_ID=MMETSP0224-20130122/13444_1 /TAXON_ID=285029 /ORGANISM="Togula jolla, Strain CCCM 725" /LENGTH=558 /DNA_ID=CAMNT_0010917383 /DNA_START=68 /DNA_END=1744 /DNA_ORIENTATION=-